jgi:hypothetical protein
MRDHRARFATAKSHRPEQPLALTNRQFYPVRPAQMMGKEFAIPQILPMPQGTGLGAQILFNPLPSRFVQTSRSPGPLALTQTAEPSRLQPLNPPFHRGGVLSQPIRNLVATNPLGGEQHPVQAVVVTGFLGTTNLILQGKDHGGRIGNL